jgi:phosphoribosylanthranilate isomerase
MTKIKVCGIKTLEAYERLQELGADYIGFVFAKSKRQVTPEQAADLGEKKADGPARVGVFVNETVEGLLHIAEVAGLHVLQLHGDESPEFCRELRQRTNLQIWKAWGVHNDERDAMLSAYTDVVDAVLLDNERGGTGERFPWDAIPALRAYTQDLPLFIAGGLHPDNVGDLLDAHATDGVDVSSGVETQGVKDLAKITAFVTKVREQR